MNWSNKFSIGVPLIDTQHQALFNGIERIYTILADHDAARDRRMTEDAIYFLEQHAVKHFADEEAYMLSINDSNFGLHKKQHNAILAELKKKSDEIQSSNYSPVAIRSLLGTLLSWLTYHTLEVDRLIGKMPPKAPESNPAIIALEQAITQVLTDMLQITPELVDPAYSGTFYGNELFCYISGSTVSFGPFKLLYAADLQVIQQAVGTLLGAPVTEVDELVLSAFEELCRVLSIHFVKKYCNNKFLQIEESRVGDMAQLNSLLPTSAPICSTLFNDPYGSFCIRVWNCN